MALPPEYIIEDFSLFCFRLNKLNFVGGFANITDLCSALNKLLKARGVKVTINLAFFREILSARIIL